MDIKLKCKMFSKYISTGTGYFLVKEQVFVSKSVRLDLGRKWKRNKVVATRPHKIHCHP